jgi:hypothetical protein
VTIETVVVAAAAAASVNAVVKEKKCVAVREEPAMCVPFSDGLMKRLYNRARRVFRAAVVIYGSVF